MDEFFARHGQWVVGVVAVGIMAGQFVWQRHRDSIREARFAAIVENELRHLADAVASVKSDLSEFKAFTEERFRNIENALLSIVAQKRK